MRKDWYKKELDSDVSKSDREYDLGIDMSYKNTSKNRDIKILSKLLCSMTHKYTNGKWYIATDHKGQTVIASNNNIKPMLCVIRNSKNCAMVTDDEANANATLMVASPDLLNELQESTNLLTSLLNTSDIPPKLIRQIEMQISKNAETLKTALG